MPPPTSAPVDVLALVRSLSRALRALGYYDAGHPVVVQTLADASAAAQRLTSGGRIVSVAGAGSTLVYDATAPGLGDEPARIVAEALFQRSVIAIRIEARATAVDLARLLGPLAEAPDRVRAAGGAAALVRAARAAGVELVEVDFRAVFAGERGGIAAELSEDPLVARALKDVLRFEAERGRSGDAVAVDLAALVDVASLGGFLDDLIDASEPGARRSDDRGRLRPGPARSALQFVGARREVSVDELADLAAEAYLAQQALPGGPDLAGSAQALADALVRLSPEARFALLRRLAGQDAAGHTEEAAVTRWGACLDGSMVVEAVASAIASEGAESEVVQAVGNVIRRLFPLESERRQLLGALDQQRAQAGQPLSGAVWQELSARALGQSGLGMLALDVAGPRRKLIANARARQRGRAPHVAGQEIVAAHGATPLAPVMAALIGALLRDPRELGPATVSGAVALVGQLEDAGRAAEADALLDALLDRADRAPSAGVSAAVSQLLHGPRGSERTSRLVRGDEGAPSRMRGELLLRALEEATDKSLRAELIQRLLRFDSRTVEALATASVEAPPARVASLLHVAVRMDARVAAQVARIVLESTRMRTKQLALQALIEAPRGPALALLGMAAGAKGDDVARKVLGLGSDAAADRHLQELQAIAIAALGLGRSPEAVPHLIPVLTRQSVLPGRAQEDLRLEAARALAINGSADALTILRAGTDHKKRNVREACERALALRK